MVRQVCYSSSAASGASETQLIEILNAARAANGAAGVSGLLAAGGGLFFQVLEGSPEAVDAILARIRADSRHRNLRIIQDITVAERGFAGCPMGFRTLDPDALRLIAARASAGQMSVAEMVATIGDPTAAAKMPRLPLAA